MGRLGLKPTLVGPLVVDCELVPPEESCNTEMYRGIRYIELTNEYMFDFIISMDRLRMHKYIYNFRNSFKCSGLMSLGAKGRKVN